MTEERLAEWESIFSDKWQAVFEGLPHVQAPFTTMNGWAVMAAKGGKELMAEVRRLSKLKEAVRVARRVQATPLNPIWQEIDALLAEDVPE